MAKLRRGYSLALALLLALQSPHSVQAASTGYVNINRRHVVTPRADYTVGTTRTEDSSATIQVPNRYRAYHGDATTSDRTIAVETTEPAVVVEEEEPSIEDVESSLEELPLQEWNKWGGDSLDEVPLDQAPAGYLAELDESHEAEDDIVLIQQNMTAEEILQEKQVLQEEQAQEAMVDTEEAVEEIVETVAEIEASETEEEGEAEEIEEAEEAEAEEDAEEEEEEEEEAGVGFVAARYPNSQQEQEESSGSGMQARYPFASVTSDRRVHRTGPVKATYTYVRHANSGDDSSTSTATANYASYTTPMNDEQSQQMESPRWTSSSGATASVSSRFRGTGGHANYPVSSAATTATSSSSSSSFSSITRNRGTNNEAPVVSETATSGGSSFASVSRHHGAYNAPATETTTSSSFSPFSRIRGTTNDAHEESTNSFSSFSRNYDTHDAEESSTSSFSSFSHNYGTTTSEESSVTSPRSSVFGGSSHTGDVVSIARRSHTYEGEGRKLQRRGLKGGTALLNPKATNRAAAKHKKAKVKKKGPIDCVQRIGKKCKKAAAKDRAEDLKANHRLAKEGEKLEPLVVPDFSLNDEPNAAYYDFTTIANNVGGVADSYSKRFYGMLGQSAGTNNIGASSIVYTTGSSGARTFGLANSEGQQDGGDEAESAEIQTMESQEKVPEFVSRPIPSRVGSPQTSTTTSNQEQGSEEEKVETLSLQDRASESQPYYGNGYLPRKAFYIPVDSQISTETSAPLATDVAAGEDGDDSENQETAVAVDAKTAFENYQNWFKEDDETGDEDEEEGGGEDSTQDNGQSQNARRPGFFSSKSNGNGNSNGTKTEASAAAFFADEDDEAGNTSGENGNDKRATTTFFHTGGANVKEEQTDGGNGNDNDDAAAAFFAEDDVVAMAQNIDNALQNEAYKDFFRDDDDVEADDENEEDGNQTKQEYDDFAATPEPNEGTKSPSNNAFVSFFGDAAAKMKNLTHRTAAPDPTTPPETVAEEIKESFGIQSGKDLNGNTFYTDKVAAAPVHVEAIGSVDLSTQKHAVFESLEPILSEHLENKLGYGLIQDYQMTLTYELSEDSVLQMRAGSDAKTYLTELVLLVELHLRSYDKSKVEGVTQEVATEAVASFFTTSNPDLQAFITVLNAKGLLTKQIVKKGEAQGSRDKPMEHSISHVTNKNGTKMTVTDDAETDEKVWSFHSLFDDDKAQTAIVAAVISGLFVLLAILGAVCYNKTRREKLLRHGRVAFDSASDYGSSAAQSLQEKVRNTRRRRQPFLFNLPFLNRRRRGGSVMSEASSQISYIQPAAIQLRRNRSAPIPVDMPLAGRQDDVIDKDKKPSSIYDIDINNDHDLVGVRHVIREEDVEFSDSDGDSSDGSISDNPTIESRLDLDRISIARSKHDDFVDENEDEEIGQFVVNDRTTFVVDDDNDGYSSYKIESPRYSPVSMNGKGTGSYYQSSDSTSNPYTQTSFAPLSPLSAALAEALSDDSPNQQPPSRPRTPVPPNPPQPSINTTGGRGMDPPPSFVHDEYYYYETQAAAPVSTEEIMPGEYINSQRWQDTYDEGETYLPDNVSASAVSRGHYSTASTLISDITTDKRLVRQARTQSRRSSSSRNRHHNKY